jgi:hypothetical protein
MLAMDLPHKYGVELQLGGGFHALTDVNDYVPANQLAAYTPAEELMIGAQFGFGLLYRQEAMFGWQFGYNRFMSLVDSKFRIADNALPTSWAEQTLSGSELYAMATWFWPWDNLELSLGVGPAIYTASLDRSVDVFTSGSHITSASFSDANGKSFGLVGALGLELPLKETLGLNVQLGGRWGKVERLNYKDPNNPDQEQPVYLSSASGSYLPVDYSGAFVKVGLRAYFQPASGWRTPGR